MTLVEFLTARLGEDEALARAAGGALWEASTPHSVHVSAAAISEHKHALARQGFVASTDHTEHATHIARHDPARVLREVEAKRAIVRLFAEELAEDERGGYLRRLKMSDSEFGRILDALRALGYLAAVYSDHPDYDEAWRP